MFKLMQKHHWFAVYMAIVGPLGNLMFYVQGYEIFHSRSAGAVSLPGFAISVIGLASWLAYGIHLKNMPLVVANAFGVFGAILVVYGILRYNFFT
jgi:MtN3 and saliva related transmembrane protein